MKTRQERRNQIIRFTILGILVLFILAVLANGVLRNKALETLSIIDNLRATQGWLSGVAITIVVFLVLVDNAEKAHFIWEIGNKLLGIDLEDMAQQQREFVELPDDYIQRPQLEQALKNALIPPKKSPRLVILEGPKDSGKTTLLHFLSSKNLNRTFKAHIVTARGDFDSIEREPNETEEQAKKRLIKRILRRIIKQVEVPGDVGETLIEMQHALQEHFMREHEPNLIIIDQIDSPSFLYSEILPYIYGASNVIAVSGTSIKIPTAAYEYEIASGIRQIIVPKSIPMIPFTSREALQMFIQEVRRRNGRVQRNQKQELSDLLTGSLPGQIQQLADVYQSGGLVRIKDVLKLRENVSQSRVVAQSIFSELSNDQLAFFIIFDLLIGDSVDENVLKFVVDEVCPNSKTNVKTYEVLKQMAISRHYLYPTKQKNEHRYNISKLGRSVASTIQSNSDRTLSLKAGAALLDFYRSIESGMSSVDLRQEIPNILGMLAWAQQIGRLLDSDLLYFMQLLRPAFSRGMNWDIGLTWLPLAEEVAQKDMLYRQLSDLLTTRGRILLASGKIKSAQLVFQEAEEANGKSKEISREDGQLGIFSPEMLTEEEHYDTIQHYWIEHLNITAQRLIIDITKQSSQIDQILAKIEPAYQWLHVHARDIDKFELRSQECAIELLQDKANILMLQGDHFYDIGQTKEARQSWNRARDTLKEARHQAQSQKAFDILAQFWRAEIKYHQRAILQNNSFINRLIQRQRGVRATIKSLENARKARSFFEESLAYYENSRLILCTLPPVMTMPERKSRRRFPFFSFRWRRLDSIRKQLVVAHATMASYGAMAHQILILHELVDVSQRLAIYDGDPSHQSDIKEFNSSIQKITVRLGDEIPIIPSRPGIMVRPIPHV